MEVINTAIRVAQISSEDKRERTVKDIFDEFNESFSVYLKKMNIIH